MWTAKTASIRKSIIKKQEGVQRQRETIDSSTRKVWRAREHLLGTYSSVMTPKSIRLLSSLAAKWKLCVPYMDVLIAYLDEVSNVSSLFEKQLTETAMTSLEAWESRKLSMCKKGKYGLRKFCLKLYEKLLQC
uniref:Uncharacterized protein n=1 Tax=Glossina austeni TaxID=7395 RepID=A0A1A9V096_GLOAU